MGAPKELLLPIMDELSKKQTTTTTTTSPSTSPTIPMILDENVNFLKFPIIDKNHEIKVIECGKNNGGGGGGSGGDYLNEISIFKNQNLKTMTPCIIKGDTNNSECINKWKDLNYFLSNHGNRIVPIELGHNKLDSKTKKQQKQQQTTTTTSNNDDDDNSIFFF
ncbi:hypothetical protein DDB_G0290881 [Dictyostelium discoideum AX4]|uniref:Uncharacterized protein n=1 Tax=Dictyostelium discoideum TaxID=44689 RepID=Q54FG1_DICDI|nr:hypothetical protein DDB_G0290881 [Dictyostelium discoideum AX4]EAL62005.1 hypothetical protein DDB_G0290881 [Dictyostelium discoideum AX4]|eukprot:XP_635510.1 hypothetical protein DDB_G0290881 [Dictyostelium discoideum AX4]